ncbi:MAG: hypothetical protein EAZ95_20075, partial [Bacteroidetes bacterium]
ELESEKHADFDNKRIFLNGEWIQVNRLEATNKKKRFRINRIDVEQDFPAVYEHLKRDEPVLQKRTDKGVHWTNMRSCAYEAEFSMPKMIYPNMTKYMPFVYDEKEHFYCNDKAYIMTGKDLQYLTCFFNSKLFKYCFADNFPELQGGTRELRKVFFEKIPVKRVGEAEAGVFARLVEYLVFLKQQKLENQYDQFMPSFFEQISEALIFELYFAEEFANSGLSVMRHLYDLPALSAESPLLHIRKIYVKYHQDTHPVRQAVYYMRAVTPVQLVQSALL